MLSKTNPTSTNSWKLLKKYSSKVINLSDAFKSDSERFKKFSIEYNDFLFDFSKNLIDETSIELLLNLAKDCKLAEAIEAFTTGEKINETEGRAVLHTALRDFSDKKTFVDEEDIIPLIKRERERIKVLCNRIHTKEWKGCTGKSIKYIVNIGIGGSDLGAVMATEALKPYWSDDIHPFFLNNIDGSNLSEIVSKINIEETLFIICSKTFTTQETISNANSVKEIFISQFDKNLLHKHFIAVTNDESKAIEFGIDKENIFHIWDWICGRFSIWSSIGIPIAITIGYNNFEDMLKGAESADLHFKKTNFEKNIPVIMGLLSVWYINFHNTKSEAILIYDQHLHKFKSFLQQASMESNGKNIDRNGEKISYQTASVLWGEIGTNGQHSFFQMLHQGTQIIPCDFIASVNNHNKVSDHQSKLLSNFLAQTEALMIGKKVKELNYDSKNIKHKFFKGNNPTNTMLIKKITPQNLGTLIAFYEHKIFVQGIIWNIFSFDQWGVELGKELSSEKLKALKEDKTNDYFDSSTLGLITKIKTWSEK